MALFRHKALHKDVKEIHSNDDTKNLNLKKNISLSSNKTLLIVSRVFSVFYEALTFSFPVLLFD